MSLPLCVQACNSYCTQHLTPSLLLLQGAVLANTTEGMIARKVSPPAPMQAPSAQRGKRKTADGMLCELRMLQAVCIAEGTVIKGCYESCLQAALSSATLCVAAPTAAPCDDALYCMTKQHPLLAFCHSLFTLLVSD